MPQVQDAPLPDPAALVPSDLMSLIANASHRPEVSAAALPPAARPHQVLLAESLLTPSTVLPLRSQPGAAAMRGCYGESHAGSTPQPHPPRTPCMLYNPQDPPTTARNTY